MEQKIKVIPLFHRVLEFINKIWKKPEESPERESYSKFKEHLRELDPEGEGYKYAVETAELCDEAYSIAKQRLVCIGRIQVLDMQIEELDCFLKLNEEEGEQLKNMLEQFLSLVKEHNALINQLTSFDRSLANMLDMEEDANHAVPQIQEAEKSQRILRHDIGQLEGEQADLDHEMNMLETGIDFINKFSIAAIVMFIVGQLVLGYRYLIEREVIFVPTTILVLLIIVTYTVLFLFRKRMKYELRMNTKKRNRAVEILNKKKVVYAYYTNFLKYEYKKYKVSNSQALKTSLKDYGNYKHITTRLDNIRRIMYETEGRVEKFLRERNLNASKFSIEQFARTVNVEDKLDYCKEVIIEKEKLEQKLTNFDTRHEAVWDKIEELSRRDISGDGAVDKIIQAYIDEVGTLIDSIDNEHKAV